MQGKVIVVGGGLAGLCAAHTILERGGRVLLLDKNSFLGGNSTKATSGINGALTKTQVRLGIQDSVEKFLEDTAQSASRGKKSDPTDLQRVLVGNSAAGVEWLGSRFGLDLSLVSRLGGHSFPRTHRGKEKFPGMTITYALMEKFEDISKENPKIAQLRVSCRVTRLLTDSTGAVVGCEYENQGKLYQEQGPVVLATGGFGADFTDDGLLKKLRPELLPLPTTNGDHCTGDGMKMGDAIGASLVDMEQVQVHPTGLVHPDDPNAKVKFLAAEALRGVGGFLLDKEGNRFCDELGRRDYVTGEMWARAKGPYRLILNSAAGKEIEWHVKHYQGRGLMKYYKSGQALAKDMGISYDKLKQTCDKYTKGASEKKDEFGKKFFHNMPVRADDSFWVAIVTPVIHYCMGGLQINPEANCVTKQGKLIPGLFACGEVTGGIHGDNRLGGSSLQDCVVYGRVAGDTAARYLMQTTLDRVTSGGGAERRLNTVAGQIGIGTTKSDTLIGATITQPGVQTRVEVEPISQRMALEVKWDQYGNVVSASGSGVAAPVPVSAAPSNVAVPTAAPATKASTSTPTTAAPAAPAKLKEYTLADVAQHKTEKDCWVVVNGQVLDVTTFLKDHPGGKQAILLYAGKDATAEFNMLHKPDVVQRYAPHTIIGTLAAGGASSGHGAPSSPKSSSKSTESKKEAAKGAPSKALKSAVAKSAELASQTPKASTESGAAGAVTKDWTKPNNTMSLTPLPKAIPSNQQSPISGGTADILPAERKKATFEIEKLTNVLDGGPERTARRRFIISPSEGTEVTDRYYMDRHELMKTHLKHFIHVHEKFMGKFVPTREEVSWMSEFAMLSGTMMNHWGLFLPTILGQANDDQVSEWLPAAFTMRIVGCYGQTELGHGSNVRGLQTTATYDKKTQEFIINTPTLQSLKWWPGTLGKVCTHALVYAQLILDGREYGVHIFMVQIRDENHRPLPGIELGDVGPKLGDGANDTGFMRITNVRVPRERMLAKYQQVAPDGTYIKAEEKTNDKMHYATMMFVRGSMVKMAGGFLARAVTIATRYACVRKQGFVNTAKDVSFRSQENAIIEYQVQRYRIFRQLALAYAMKFTGKWMIDRFKDLEGAGAGVIVDTAALPEIAATSAGLKAFCTFLTSQGIEDCRKCCGGNGYLLSSGIGALSQDYVWQTTAEGDFIVLMLQTARFLMKSVRDARAKKPVAGFVEYLAPLADPKFNPAKAAPAEAKTVKDFLNLDYLTSLFKYRAMMAVVAVGDELARKQQSGLSFDDAWNTVAVQLCDATKAHCYAFMVNTFVQAVRQAKEDKDVQTVLGRICALFALSNIQDDQWAGFGVIHVDQMRLVRAAVAQLLDELRPDAVAMVDAFDIPDRVLNSTIGMYDGNVYEALYEAAKKSQLNQVDPFDGYHDVLRPRLDLELLKQGNSKL